MQPGVGHNQPQKPTGFKVERIWTNYVTRTRVTLKHETHVVRGEDGILQEKTIPIEQFETYLAPVDMVCLAQFGEAGRSATDLRINDINKVRPVVSANDTAAVLANARWEAVRPHYEAYKAGEKMPEIGTPLEAWNAVDPQKLFLLKQAGVRTVDELAALTDAVIARLPFPNARDLVHMAKSFLTAQSSNATAVQIEAAKAEAVAANAAVEDLKAQLREMQAMIAAQNEPKPVKEKKAA